ncbi:MAG: hypothetical protein ACTHNS_16180 [Marmoricola sp.]
MSGAEASYGQIVFVPVLPATISAVNARVGAEVAGPLLSLASGPLIVRGAPTAADATSIRRGERVRLLLTPGGEAVGTVSGSRHLAQAADDQAPPGAADPNAAPVQFTVRPQHRLPARSAGSPARVLVTVSTSPHPGLTVPLSAISASADGSDTVTVLRKQRKAVVGVTTGYSGDGYVQVRPASDGLLRAGDEVVVGVGVGSAA